MSVSWSSPPRRGIDPGCGCGIRQFSSELLAGKARDKGAALAGADAMPRLRECPRRPGTWHLVAPAADDITPEVRRLVLKRDGHRCVCCGISVKGRRYSIGHRVRRSQGGSDLPSNLITLLGLGGEQCHGRIDNRADPHDEGKGYALRSWQDPAQVGVMIFSEHGSGVTKWLSGDGTYLDEQPAEVAA